jgi:hypothetical protein
LSSQVIETDLGVDNPATLLLSPSSKAPPSEKPPPPPTEKPPPPPVEPDKRRDDGGNSVDDDEDVKKREVDEPVYQKQQKRPVSFFETSKVAFENLQPQQHSKDVRVERASLIPDWP